MQTLLKSRNRVRTIRPKSEVIQMAVANPYLIMRELNNRSFYKFLLCLWPEYSQEVFKDNWHIKLLCDILQEMAENVGKGLPKLYDLLVNIPPGTTKTAICSIFFPAWCWTRWYWMRFIMFSYSAPLSLESAEYSRDLIRSDLFKKIYPELSIKQDKDIKSNYRIVKEIENPDGTTSKKAGGNRLSTSIDGIGTGFHGHINIWDDILNPKEAVSEAELANVRLFLDQTLPTRKVDKKVSVTIGIMQRLAQGDPTGHLLEKKKKKIKHLCLPGELGPYEQYVKPPELKKYYVDGLLDPVRMPRDVLEELEDELGQYGYAGQIGQNPTPPAGGMFKVDHFAKVTSMPALVSIVKSVRFWDKAGTVPDPKKKNKPAWTVGTLMHHLANGKWLVSDVVRGQWASEEREDIIESTAEADGTRVEVWYEQEPGSGGKESAESTTKNLAGFSAHAEIPKGDKVFRADPYSVQVNKGNVQLLAGDWNAEFIKEHRFFPFSTYKDQVDSAGAAFAKLAGRKEVKVYGRKRRRA